MMAKHTVSLTDQMSTYVSNQVGTGKYGNFSEYVRDLIRQEQQRDEVHTLRALINEGLESGISEKSHDQIFSELKKIITKT